MEADVAAELAVGDAAGGHQPAHMPRRRVQALGHLLHGQQVLHAHLPAARSARVGVAGTAADRPSPLECSASGGTAVNSASRRWPYRSLTPAARARPAPVGVCPAATWA